MMSLLDRRALGRWMAALLGAAALSRFAGPAEAAGPRPFNSGPDGLMLRGYDPVAYFDQGQPMLGDPAIQLVQDGLVWRFSSAENRAAFLADPSRYQPAYGGYCAMGMALEREIDGDPQVWRIVDGRLFLNVDQAVQALWGQDIAGNVAQADRNWPKIKDASPDHPGG